MNVAVKALFLSLSLGALSLPAMAQSEKQPEGQKPQPRENGERPRRGPGEGGGERRMGPQLSKEKLEAAWNAEATGAAKRLNLSTEQTSAVVKAYTDARSSVRDKMEELRGKGGEPGANRDAMREAETSAKEKFSKALTDAKISSDNAAKLNASLGAAGLAGPVWDRMTDAILGMNLDAGKKQSAQNAIEDFVVAQTKTAGTAREDREAAREAMQKNREDLDSALKGVLTEDQMKTFDQAVPRAGGMRRGPDGERPGRGPEGGKPEGGKPDHGNGKDKDKPKK